MKNGSASKVVKPTNRSNGKGASSSDINNKTSSSSPQPTSMSTRNALVYLVIIFVFSILSLGYVYSMFPELEEAEKEHIKLPRDIEDAKHLGAVLSRYKERYYTEVLGGVFITYIL